MKLRIYLAGAMEADTDLGAGWRTEISPTLIAMGAEIFNPCLFEPMQLKGLRPDILPTQVPHKDGGTFSPQHWHELKSCPRHSKYYQRFLSYMHRIIHYDIELVETGIDIVLCNWKKATAKGAGTHSELTAAFRSGVPVYTVEHEDSPLPAWAAACSTRILSNMDDCLAHIKKDFFSIDK